MGFLVMNVEEKTYAVAAPVGDRTVIGRIGRLATRHGYEMRFEHRKTFAERREWPLTIFAYTSNRADGMGRSGSQAYSFPARQVPCLSCSGRGSHEGTGTCKWCRGTGRRFAKRGSRG